MHNIAICLHVWLVADRKFCRCVDIYYIAHMYACQCFLHSAYVPNVHLGDKHSPNVFGHKIFRRHNVYKAHQKERV
jgi:hypothetical protein